jgi:hypothetical protein
VGARAAYLSLRPPFPSHRANRAPIVDPRALNPVILDREPVVDRKGQMVTSTSVRPQFAISKAVRVAALAAAFTAALLVPGTGTAFAQSVKVVHPAIRLSSAKVTPEDPICVTYGLEPPASYRLTVKGTSFKPFEKVAIRMTRLGSRVVAKAQADAAGGFSVTFTDPVQPAAVEKVTARGSRGSFAVRRVTSEYASCYVTTNPAPWDGVGWKAGSAVQFKVGRTVASTAHANKEGSFSVSAPYTCGTAAKSVRIIGTVFNKHIVIKGGTVC